MKIYTDVDIVGARCRSRGQSCRQLLAEDLDTGQAHHPAKLPLKVRILKEKR